MLGQIQNKLSYSPTFYQSIHVWMKRQGYYKTTVKSLQRFGHFDASIPNCLDQLMTFKTSVTKQ